MIIVKFYSQYIPGSLGIVSYSGNMPKKKLIKTKIFKYRAMANLAMWWWKLGTLSSILNKMPGRGFHIYYCREELEQDK